MASQTPILHLARYDTNGFIRARVVYKSDLITLRNGMKQLRLHLMDDSGIISAVAYGEEAKKFHDIFQCDKVYELSGFIIISANKHFTNLTHDYEVLLKESTICLEMFNEASNNIPAIQYNFTTIADIHKLPENRLVDCIAVCRKVNYLQGGESAYKKDYQKRNLELMDNSNAVIELTIWNKDASNLEELAPFIIALRKATIKVFRGKKSLSMNKGSFFKINPSSLPECENLKPFLNFKWRDSFLSRKQFPPTGYFKTKGVIYCIDTSNICYQSCIRCWRKVCKSSDGKYHCGTCKMVSTDFKYKLLLNLHIGEPFTNIKVTCFNESVENFIGRSAEEVALALKHDPTGAEEIFKSIYYKTFIFNLDVTNEMYEGEMKSKPKLISATPINTREYNKYLINNLKNFIPIE